MGALLAASRPTRNHWSSAILAFSEQCLDAETVVSHFGGFHVISAAVLINKPPRREKVIH